MRGQRPRKHAVKRRSRVRRLMKNLNRGMVEIHAVVDARMKSAQRWIERHLLVASGLATMAQLERYDREF